MQVNRPLPANFQLSEYRILKVIASGGFSYVYLAHDAREMPVALKEYLPASLAVRAGPDAAVTVPEDMRAVFGQGMRCFFEEARALAGMRHPNVVRVFSILRGNGTAYMAMRYERGRTLQEHIVRRGPPMHEGSLRATFAGLLNGLREVHARRLLHLDIKPGNIYLRNDGTPLLLDFGAARQALAAESGALRPMHTPGFASPEHVERRERLGPWSDVYSVGASLYACLSGGPPPAVEARLDHDRLRPARAAWKGKYSAELLGIVDWCLRLDPRQRPQSVLALQKALAGNGAPAPLHDAAPSGGLAPAALGVAVS